MPSRLGPAVVVYAMPSPLNDDKVVCRALQEGAVTSSARASYVAASPGLNLIACP